MTSGNGRNRSPAPVSRNAESGFWRGQREPSHPAFAAIRRSGSSRARRTMLSPGCSSSGSFASSRVFRQRMQATPPPGLIQTAPSSRLFRLDGDLFFFCPGIFPPGEEGKDRRSDPITIRYTERLPRRSAPQNDRKGGNSKLSQEDCYLGLIPERAACPSSGRQARCMRR